MPPRACHYCQQTFQPSKHRPDQSACSRTECQIQRHRDYRRKKLQSDPEYAQVVRDSRKKWRAAHPDYQKNYRQAHPQAVELNRRQQRQRDCKRHLGNLVKNTLVFDLKPCASEVWFLGPGAADLEKNILVPAKLLILQAGQPIQAGPITS